MAHKTILKPVSKVKSPIEPEKQREAHQVFKKRALDRVISLINTQKYVDLNKKITEDRAVLDGLLSKVFQDIINTESTFMADDLIGAAGIIILQRSTVFGIVMGISGMAYAEHEAGFVEKAALDFKLAEEIAILQTRDEELKELYDIALGMLTIRDNMRLCGFDTVSISKKIDEMRKKNKLLNNMLALLDTDKKPLPRELLVDENILYELLSGNKPV